MASEPFEVAAQSHGDAIGFHADGIFVTHPIQDRNIGEMKELAETFFESILGLICKKSTQR